MPTAGGLTCNALSSMRVPSTMTGLRHELHALEDPCGSDSEAPEQEASLCQVIVLGDEEVLELLFSS